MSVTAFEERLRLNRLVFDGVRQQYRIGMTEQDIRTIIETVWADNAPTAIEFSGDVIGGIRSGAIEGLPTDYVLRCGDALILDLQPGYDGWYADTTRTFFIGKASEEQRAVYTAVAATLSRLEALLRPGVRACDVYYAMQRSLAEFGYTCPHHAGHALGSEKLLAPEFVEDCTDELCEGMFVALEPGVYLSERFGVRYHRRRMRGIVSVSVGY